MIQDELYRDAARAVGDAACALWGEDWGKPLAREVQVNLRTAQRIKKAWREGVGYSMSPLVAERLSALLKAETAPLVLALRNLEAARAAWPVNGHQAGASSNASDTASMAAVESR